MTKYIDTVEVARIIRKELKQHFKGVKFKVRSSRYSGGSSIQVKWIDGPKEEQVSSVIGHYHGATFDGMTDLMSYHTSTHEEEEVRFGNNFLFIDRELSSEGWDTVHRIFEEKFGRAFDLDKCDYDDRVRRARIIQDLDLRSLAASV